jgi:hypothetical protein
VAIQHRMDRAFGRDLDIGESPDQAFSDLTGTPADHCRGGCQGSDLRFGQETLLVGGGMPGRGRERGSESQPTLAEG